MLKTQYSPRFTFLTSCFQVRLQHPPHRPIRRRSPSHLKTMFDGSSTMSLERMTFGKANGRQLNEHSRAKTLLCYFPLGVESPSLSNSLPCCCQGDVSLWIPS